MLDIQDYTQVGLAHNPSNATILTLHTPYKAQRLELQLANGLDSILESKDREQTQQTRESKKSQQNKRHNTDIASSHTESKQKDSKDKDSSLTAQNDDSLSTSMLHPILEDNEIKCPHNGVVKLKSNRGKSFTSKGIPMVLESDLLNASIIGCANPMQYNNTSL